MQPLIQRFKSLFTRPKFILIGRIIPEELAALPKPIQMRRYPARRFVEQPPREILHGLDEPDSHGMRGQGFRIFE